MAWSPSGSQRHSPEDKKGVTESFWKSRGGVEQTVLQPLHRRELGPVWARLTWRSGLGRGEHAVNRRMVAEGQQRAWGCQTRQAGSGRWTDFSSPWLGPGHSASRRAAGPGPYSAQDAGNDWRPPAPRPGLLTSAAQPQADGSDCPFPEGSSLTPQVLGGHPLLPRSRWSHPGSPPRPALW